MKRPSLSNEGTGVTCPGFQEGCPARSLTQFPGSSFPSSPGSSLASNLVSELAAASGEMGDILPVSRAGSAGRRLLLSEPSTRPAPLLTNCRGHPGPPHTGSSPQAQRTQNHRAPKLQEPWQPQTQPPYPATGQTEAW